MRSPFKKLRIGITALAIVFTAAVLAFHYLADYSWNESLWMVVITISTVGYGEHSTVEPTTRLICVAVILLGVTAGAYTFGGMIQIILQGELDRVLGRRRMESELRRLDNHTIVCGFGRIGSVLTQQLSLLKQPFVVIENDPEKIENARQFQHLIIEADATEEQCLEQAQIERARAIVIALPTDAQNVFITLTARNMRTGIHIVAQAEHETSCKKLRQAGANDIVLAHQMVAQHMARLITRPSTAKLFSLLAESSRIDFELDELKIPPQNKLIGNTIAKLRIRDRYDLLVIGVKPLDSELDFNPEANRIFAAEETILIMGKAADIDRFRKDYQLGV